MANRTATPGSRRDHAATAARSLLRAAAIGALLPGLAAFACVSTPPAQAPATLVGCWYFDRDAAATALNLPWGVRLSGEVLTGWPLVEARGAPHLAATLSPEGEVDHPFGYWMHMPGDSIEIGYPGGGGLVLHLAAGEMAMTGNARAVGDVITLDSQGPPPIRAIRVTRAQCPTEP